MPLIIISHNYEADLKLVALVVEVVLRSMY